MNTFNSLRERIRNAHRDHHDIARGMAWVTLFVFFGKLAGAAKEMAVAYRYGIGEEVDAYLFVLNLVSWPIGVWFSVLTVVLVPLVGRIRSDASDGLPRFRAELFGLTLLLGVGLGLFVWIGLPLLLDSTWTGLPLSSVSIANGMVTGLLLLAPLGVVISLFSAWMLCAGRHANTLLESVPALVILVAILAFPGGGVEPLVWGTVAGFAFHLVSLAASLVRRSEIEAPRFTREAPQWPLFWQGFGIMLIGQALMSLIGIIDQFFAAHLGIGSIATLGYANRILAMILGIVAIAVTRATLPVFSRIQAQAGAQRHLNSITVRWVKLLFVSGVVTMIAGWYLAPWLVKLLFERGAFMVGNTQAVTEVLRWGLVQLPFYYVGILLVSLLTSQARYRTVTIVGAINLIVKIIANYVFAEWLGVSGIMLATTVMLAVSTLMLGVVLYFDIGKGVTNENSEPA